MYDNNRKIGNRNTKTHQAAARKIAAEGVVLLKNKVVDSTPVLPLNITKIKNILVLGPNADKKHGTGGGSSEVKSLYEVTPLAGLKAALGDNVSINVMRAKSSELSPIASDYVAGRHWTGTPAWNISYYAEQARKTLIEESWIVDSQFKPKKQLSPQHITMKAKIKPLASGIHHLHAEVQGDFQLKINNELVITYQEGISSKSALNYDISLEESEEYAFEIEYDGQKHFMLGWNAPGELFTSETDYLTAAKKADAVIYFGGLSHADDRESIDRSNMKLPNSQDEIIAKLLKVNKKTIIFLVAGSAVEMPWVEQANAIVWGWYGGMEAGNAFADVLTGKVNPSGKMPITLPVRLEDTAPIALNDYTAKESLYTEGVFIGYRWFEQQKIKPLFSFGHGLSFTQFDISNIKLSKNTVAHNDDIFVTATVKNIGTVRRRSGTTLPT
ncbi:glycoside hydrolase family 3 C-terminal domain-containing protein [Colwellia sp. MSW7]|uniref:Glycoside hydrolase family 3 C-terminal domain-containing protein n=2 Tax=Colwellia maritima TaxID=2912588 RepID=A0ABS9WYI8_9GAMM|nr:glycoside hydrolase family 3 C-terminal domain-containing protein [Colwellia maritima]